MNLCSRLRKAAQKLRVKAKGSGSRAGIVFFDAVLLINFLLQQTAEPPHCAFGYSLAWHDLQAAPQVRNKMKISEGRKYLNENLKALQPAEWQPVHTCFCRCRTGSYY